MKKELWVGNAKWMSSPAYDSLWWGADETKTPPPPPNKTRHGCWLNVTWLYLALATCLVSILPYCGGLQENSTKSSSCSKMAGYMTCRFSGPTQMACGGEGSHKQTLLTFTKGDGGIVIRRSAQRTLCVVDGMWCAIGRHGRAVEMTTSSFFYVYTDIYRGKGWRGPCASLWPSSHIFGHDSVVFTPHGNKSARRTFSPTPLLLWMSTHTSALTDVKFWEEGCENLQSLHGKFEE